MENKILKIAKIVFLIVHIITIMLVFFFNDNSDYFFDEENVRFESSWEIVNEDGTKSPIEIPYKITEDLITITTKLPKVTDNNIIAFESRYENLKAYVNGEVIYESSKANLGSISTSAGNYVVMIHLDEDFSDQDLVIKLERRQNFYEQSLNNVFLTTMDAYALYNITSNIPTLIYVIIFYLISLFAFIIYLIMKFVKYNFKEDLLKTFLYLSFFTFTLALWISTNLNIFSIISGKFALYGLLNFISFMVLPISVFALIESLIKVEYKATKIVHIASLSIITFNFIAFFTGLLDLPKTLFLAQIVDILLLICLFVNVIIAIKQKKIQNNKLMVTGISMIGILCLTSLILYVLDFNWMNTIYVACFIAILTLFVVCLIRLIEATREMFKNKEYIYYAYNDELTGLLNRQSYKEKLQELENKGINDKTIIVALDLNNLKITNDTYGHLVGDELIIQGAKLISETFKDYGTCYRVGGDEFVVIIEKEIDNIEELLKELESKTTVVDEDGNVKLSIAYGYSIMDPNDNKDINEYIKEADMAMYLNKKEYYSKKENDRKNN